MGGSKLQDLFGTVLDLLRFLGGGLRNVAPVIGILLVFQLLVLRQPLENWREIAIGLALTVVGLVIFLRGLEMGLTPLGEAASGALARRGSLVLVTVFGVALGYGATLADFGGDLKGAMTPESDSYCPVRRRAEGHVTLLSEALADGGRAVSRTIRMAPD